MYVYVFTETKGIRHLCNGLTRGFEFWKANSSPPRKNTYSGALSHLSSPFVNSLLIFLPQ